MSNVLSIIPFLVIIPVAMWTRKVIPGLVLGLLVASYLVVPTPIGGISQASEYVVTNLANKNKLYIIGFLYIFAGIINLIKVSGGIKGFIELTCEKIKTRKQTFLLIWITLAGTFSSPKLRVVTVAPIIKAIQMRIDATKERLAYLIEATGIPIIVLIPIATAFVGYMTSTIELSLENAGLNGDPFKLYIQSIPYNLFSIFTIFLAVIYTVLGHPKLYKEDTIQVNKEDDQKQYEDCHPVAGKDLDSKSLNLFIPIISALILSIFLSFLDGYNKTGNLRTAFIEANVTKAMFDAILITLFITVIMLLVQKISLNKIINEFFVGSNNLMPPITIFALVWGLAAATEDLNLSSFVASSLDFVPHLLVVPVTFLIGSLLAYFVGSAWGSWGLLMPIGLTLAAVSQVSLPLMIGVIFASGTFGGLVSPLSGTTITMAKIMDLDVMDYSKYKLKHSIAAIVLSTIGYFIIELIM
ncbi:Na+/H+ antiporter NhaC family protein [Haloplasma contractile]|uniref:Na+-H+ antiporter NhaC-like protein n=1 Tax=Haloplasma contractile SSD-17B TaxID=1033810 RepID=F7Q231_9MOLU|nr:Na+/H+ antiporter NhaC family protein [Haloplasma contractile]ERJ12161.1 Na+-H+ antiporter NhaC-like protein [Haloplasma contractile SSD-17B]